ncbi:hypothetical protein BDZ97DRAFT_1873423 [Flammula alnicola]|nr:hypothetical protein BDZ97DRAFT_1873423 [Flammula alnicola]
MLGSHSYIIEIFQRRLGVRIWQCRRQHINPNVIQMGRDRNSIHLVRSYLVSRFRRKCLSLAYPIHSGYVETPVGLQSQISQIFWTAIKYFVVGLDYLIGFVKHCVNSLSLSAEENTSISFCLLVLVGIALNIIGTPFERPSSTPTTQDKQLTKGQELLGEDWKVHEEIRAQVEREREAWKQEQKDMEKRREEDRLREKERQVMAVERKKWEREKKKRDNVKKRFEADKKKSEDKWKKEQEKTRKWKDDIEREKKVTVKNLPD